MKLEIETHESTGMALMMLRFSNNRMAAYMLICIKALYTNRMLFHKRPRNAEGSV